MHNYLHYMSWKLFGCTVFFSFFRSILSLPHPRGHWPPPFPPPPSVRKRRSEKIKILLLLPSFLQLDAVLVATSLSQQPENPFYLFSPPPLALPVPMRGRRRKEEGIGWWLNWRRAPFERRGRVEK